MSDSDIERRIVTGLIVSDEFAGRVRGFWRDDLLDSPEAVRIARWCVDHHARYGRAPGRHIEDIYMRELHAGGLQKAEAELIERILGRISDDYDRGDQFNAAYLFDRAVEYLRSREISRHSEHVRDLVDRGDVALADEAVRSFRPTSWVTSRGLDVGSAEGLRRLEESFASSTQPVIRYPGALGTLLNHHLVRDGLVGITSPEKRGKCLPGSERVLLSTGEVLPLRDVVESGRCDVIAYDEESGQFVASRATLFYRNGKKTVWEVGTRSGRRVRCTINHPFLTPDGWTELGSIPIGQFVAVPKHIPIFGDLDMPEHEVRLLAYIIADGCLGSAEYRHTSFSKGDEELRRDFQWCVERMGCRVRWRGIDGFVTNSDANRHRHGMNYVSNFLGAHGLMGKHSYEKLIPECVYRLNSRKLATFLSILMTCDGWVSEGDGGVGFAVANEPLSRQVQELLSRYGIVSRLRFIPNDKRGAWEVAIKDYENLCLFRNRIGLAFDKGAKLSRILETKPKSSRSFLDKFPPKVAARFYDAAEAEFHVSERTYRDPHYRRFIRTFTKASAVRYQLAKSAPIMRQTFEEVRYTEAGRRYMDAAIMWDEIVYVNCVGVEETFDLTVDEHHNFVAENMLVHNTFMLLELSMRALRQRANVAFFQAGDLSEGQFLRRIGIYVARRSDQEMYCQPYWRAIGDCVLNQIDSCRRPDRNCDHGVFDATEERYREDRVAYSTHEALVRAAEEHPDYRPCDSATCARRWPAAWVVRVPESRPLSGPEAARLTGEFFSQHRRRFKLATYANGTLDVAEMESCLDEWERADDFVPDVIVSDYADIMTAREAEFRHRQNEVWKGLRSLSQRRHALVLTATQSDAASYRANSLNLGNFSEDKRKYAHVTAMFSLNQSPDGREAQLGIVRIGEMVVREGAKLGVEVTVLQDLRRGRAYLESFAPGLRPSRSPDG